MECRKHVTVLLLLGLLVLFSYVVFADPEGPTTLDIINVSRRTPVTSPTIDAIAGNVTQLEIIGLTVTQSWQGYYGNVTGTITLDDSQNHTMYDWALAEPEGEIYASEDTVTWTSGNVKCYDFEKSDVGDGPYHTLEELEARYGIVTTDIDGINETFTETDWDTGTGYDEFYVGEYYINQTCPMTNIYNHTETSGAGEFTEFLLYDNTSRRPVWTAIIEETDMQGFDDRYWDFEMIVTEDGHNGSTATTTYYFYVELE